MSLKIFSLPCTPIVENIGKSKDLKYFVMFIFSHYFENDIRFVFSNGK